MMIFHLPSTVAMLARGAALSAFVAMPAAAATMQAVYTGTVTYGTDLSGVFGTPGASLDGAEFTATFRYDTTKGLAGGNEYYQSVVGYWVYPQPIFYAALTINGLTGLVYGITYSWVMNYDLQTTEVSGTETWHLAEAYFDDFYASNYIHLTIFDEDRSLAIPLDLTQAFTAVVDPQNMDQYGYGNFSFDDFGNGNGKIRGSLRATKVVVSAVPLPAGLPLLAFAIVGLAVVGCRRRVELGLS
jgi:hypothetical protein